VGDRQAVVVEYVAGSRPAATDVRSAQYAGDPIVGAHDGPFDVTGGTSEQDGQQNYETAGQHAIDEQNDAQRSTGHQ